METIDLALLQKYFLDKPVLKAYLFGSYARNEQNADSDIDILVELDYKQNIGLEFVQMQIDLENILNKLVDLVSYKALSKYIKPIVENEKRLFYER